MLTREEEQAVVKEAGEPMKARSFRLTEATTEAFKQISETLGENQQHTMEVLIEAYKSQYDKSCLKEAGKYDDFEKYLSVIRNMFMDVLRANEDAMVLARNDVAAQLESKDNIIMELQTELEKARKAETDAQNVIKPLKDENSALKDRLEKEKKEYEDKLSVASETETELRNTVDSLKKELEDVREREKKTDKAYKDCVDNTLRLQKELDYSKDQEKPLKENISKVVSENRLLVKENETLSKQNDSLSSEIESLKSSRANEIELVMSQAELKAKNEAFEALREKQMELDAIKDKYLALLEENAIARNNNKSAN